MTQSPERSADEYAERVNRFLARFDSVAHELQERAPSTISESERVSYQNELDDLCPYLDQQCYVSGYGIVPILDGDGDWLGEERQSCEGMTAKNRGVAIRMLEGDDFYKPYHYFFIASSDVWRAATRQDESNVFAYLERNANIVSYSTINTLFNDEDKAHTIHIPADIDDSLRQHSDWFRNTIRSQNFLRRTRTSQLRFVDDYLSFVNEKFKIEQAGVSVAGSYCLRTVLHTGDVAENLEPLGRPTDDTLRYTREIIDLSHQHPFRGVVRGFVTPEREMLHTAPLRRYADMIDPAAGLCMAIELLRHYESPRLSATDVVHLPLSSQSYQLSFHEPTTEWLIGALY